MEKNNLEDLAGKKCPPPIIIGLSNLSKKGQKILKAVGFFATFDYFERILKLSHVTLLSNIFWIDIEQEGGVAQRCVC